MTGRCRGAYAVVQVLINLSSINGELEMRVRLTRCRSYVVLVRRVPSSLLFWPSPTLAWLAGVCSPRTASPLAASCWRQRRSQHGIPPPHFPGQRVPLPCTQQSADTAIFSIHSLDSLRPESPGVHSSLLDPRPLRSNHLQHKPLARDRCTHTSFNLTSPPRRYPFEPPTPTPAPVHTDLHTH